MLACVSVKNTRKLKEKVIVIGSGFSGLATAAVLAKNGVDVTVLEKNSTLGGRARQFQADGFTFDMGPSWYWMPEVFENFYKEFGYKVSDFYELARLSPSYRVYFEDHSSLDIPADYEELLLLFESYETGAGAKLDAFLKEAEYKYRVGMDEFVWKPSHSITEFFDLRIMKSSLKLQMFSSISKQIRKLFSHPHLIKILEFPVLFLGATPQDTPALYSLMNYADLKLGTWYPKGGMYKIVEAMVTIAKAQGVKFVMNQEVTSVTTGEKQIKAVNTQDQSYECDYLVASCDYHHFDQNILGQGESNYSESYWDSRVMAPSSLLFYLGVSKKVSGLKHHMLFFDEDFELHANEIYKSPRWPSKPLFYSCSPSVTDATVAPAGFENIFLLMPLAPDLEDSEELREHYFEVMLKRLKDVAGIDIKDNIIYKRSYCLTDFKKDYHAFKGNAYGLANTLTQTAFLKPKLRHKSLQNLYYAGQLTTPGPGVPPSIISGQVVAAELLKTIKQLLYVRSV